MVQVPANATAAIGAENAAASVSSSLFGALAGTASAKKGQLPSFAAILAEQPVDSGAGKNVEALFGAMDEGGTDGHLQIASSETASAHVKALFNLLPEEEKSSDAVLDKTTSVAPESSKHETKAARHRATGASSSSESGKKPSVTAVETAIPAGIASTPLIASQVASEVASEGASVVPSEKPSHVHSGAFLPSVSTATEQHFSTTQISITRAQKSELHIQAPVPASMDVAESEVSPAPLMRDMLKRDFPLQETSPVKPQYPITSHVPDADEAAVAAPQNEPHTRQVLSRTSVFSIPGSTNGIGMATAGFTGSAVHPAASQGIVPPLSKARTQEKTAGDAVRGMTASLAASGGSLAETVSSHSVASATGQPLRMAESVDLSSKQVPAIIGENAFQRLDSGQAPATLLHTSAHQIVVGVHDPSLGWVEVETQSSAGHISATLTAGSTEAHASLAAQAPAITQYLADRDVSIHNLHVYTQADPQGGASGGGQSQSGSENDSYRMPRQGGGTESSQPVSFNQTENEAMSQPENALYISVRA